MVGPLDDLDDHILERLTVEQMARLNNLADLDLALACARQCADYLQKARETQDDGLEHEYLALAQHLVQTIIATLTAGAG
jgi:hypothetical protein